MASSIEELRRAAEGAEAGARQRQATLTLSEFINANGGLGAFGDTSSPAGRAQAQENARRAWQETGGRRGQTIEQIRIEDISRGVLGLDPIIRPGGPTSPGAQFRSRRDPGGTGSADLQFDPGAPAPDAAPTGGGALQAALDFLRNFSFGGGA